MTSSTRLRTGRRARAVDERGSVMVEFGLIAIVLFTLLFGLIEGGLLVRARNAVNSAADEAARRGATAAANPYADWMILQQIRTRGTHRIAQINYVVVYRADSAGSPANEGCLSGQPLPGVCNVYRPEAFELGRDAFGCSSAILDANWCPSDREISEGAFEYLGVHIDAEHVGFTGIFGDIALQGTGRRAVEGSGSSGFSLAGGTTTGGEEGESSTTGFDPESPENATTGVNDTSSTTSGGFSANG